MSSGNPPNSVRVHAKATSAYIHVPFCRHRCGYCNFALVANRDYLVERYLKAIEWEIHQLPTTPTLSTLYLGGGTPSQLEITDLQKLIGILKTRFHWTVDTEFTVECNPSDLCAEKIEGIRQLGINRISLGVQSLNPGKLKVLERDHSPEQVQRVVKHCREVFESVSIDLIFATPQESMQEWVTDLEQALELEPHHVSTYELTYEKGTAFWNRRKKGSFVEAHDDLKTHMYEWAIERLESAGFQHYEVSSFARPGFESRHNNVYWSGRDYFAFGPGASSYLDGTRATRHQSPLTYLKRIETGQSPITESETLSLRDRTLEHLVIGLRRRKGIDVTEFNSQNNCEIDGLCKDLFIRLQELNLIERSGNRLFVTHAGLLVNDWIATQILRVT